MTKTFTIENIEYTFEEVTAIAISAGDHTEDKRQKVLLVTNENKFGEKSEFVVFGFNMPEDEDDVKNIFTEPSAWDSNWETLETVREIR